MTTARAASRAAATADVVERVTVSEQAPPERSRLDGKRRSHLQMRYESFRQER